VLTVKQPHLAALLEHRKPAEYRSWAVAYRGAVALHAALKIDRDAYGWYGFPAGRKLPTGCVVAVATLVSIEPAEDFDGYAWKFEDFQVLARPVVAVGRLGLWQADAALEAAILAQLGPRPRRPAA